MGILTPPGDLVAPNNGPDVDWLLPIVRHTENSGSKAVSPKGAIGIFQIMPATARQYGFDPKRLTDDDYNEQAARAILTDLHKKAGGDPASILVGYNAGPGRIKAFQKSNYDPQSVPPETRNYLQRALDFVGQSIVPSARAGEMPAQTPPSDLIEPPPDLVDASPPADVVAPPSAQNAPALPAGSWAASDITPQELEMMQRGVGTQLPGEGEGPGIVGALKEGTVAALRGLKQTGQTVTGGRPEEAPAGSVASRPLQWADFANPDLVAQKMAYGLAEGSPTIAGGVAGAGAGAAAGAAIPVGGETGVPEVIGGIAGGALGAAAGGAAQTLGPYYATALKQMPNDPQGAFDLALRQAETDGAISGVAWAAFGVAPFKKQVANLLFQAFGVQPAISMAGHAIKNVQEGKPAGEDIAADYPGAVASTLVPAIGHGIITKTMGRETPRAAPTPSEAPSKGEASPSSPPNSPTERPAAAPPPMAEGQTIGVKVKNGPPKRATVEAYFDNGNAVALRFDDGQVRHFLTAEVQRDLTAPPPAMEATPTPIYHGEPLTQAEREAAPLPDEYPQAPRRAPPQPTLAPDNLQALDQAHNLERRALDRSLSLSGAERQDMLTQAAALRRQYGVPEESDVAPQQYQHPLADEPARDLGELAKGRVENPELFQGERPAIEAPIANRGTIGASDKTGTERAVQTPSGDLRQVPRAPEGERAAPVPRVPDRSAAPAQTAQEIDRAAAKTDFNPSDAQIASGNYRKAKIRVKGLDVSIETPRGAVRRGTGANGEPWENINPMAHYGYVKGTVGADNSHVDTYVGPHPGSDVAFVVDQIDPQTGAFDEHKLVLGAGSAKQATAIYDAGFSDGSGPQRRGAVTKVPIPELKTWLKEGDTKAPFNAQADPDFMATSEDVRFARSNAIGDKHLLDVIRNMGGIRVTDHAGKVTPEGQTIQQILQGGYRRLINKRGLPADSIRERLEENGWFGSREPGQTDLQDFYDLLERAARGEKVYHPESDAPGIRERRSFITDEMGRAGVKAADSVPDATKKLMAFRRQEAERQADQEEPGVDRDAEDLSPGAQELLVQYGYEPGADFGEETQSQETQPLAPEPARAPEAIGPTEPAAEGPQSSGQDGQEAEAGRPPAESFAAEPQDLGQGQTADQLVIPGGEQSAQQAAKAREAQGHGRATTKVEQKPAEGLFAEKRAEEPDMFAPQKARSAGARPPKTPEYPLAPREDWYGEANYKQTGGKLSYMSPDEFLNQVRPLKVDETARENIDDLKRHIESGGALDPLQIGANGKEDGRHRAIAAKELGIRTVPVLTWERAASAKSLAPTTRIEDFGEVLTGARKRYADKMKDAKALDVAAEPLSKTWPEPDYADLVKGGSDPWTVAFIRSARDEIPTKPQRAWKLKGWVDKVTGLREFANRLLDGRLTKDQILQKLNEPQFAHLKSELTGRTDLYQAVGHDISLKGVSLTAGSYSVYRGVNYKPAKTIWAMERPAKATAFGNMPRTLAEGNTRQEAIENFKKKIAEGVSPKERETRFDIYARRKPGDQKTYFIGKKVGKSVIELKSFDDVKAARAYLADNKSDLEKILERKKFVPNERKETNSPRVGADHRDGADVTPEHFSDAFGFRGVQFGNYVEGGRRQADLNEAYDALMDMAGILDVPAKALSLNGELGLAFGARGTGGVHAAKAHYEPDTVVINLTKAHGAGSLAHEWWHGLDNYFSRARGDKGYVTEHPEPRGEGVRPEMVSAFKRVVEAINSTAIRKRSRVLDARRSNEYWSTGRELSARSFESYIAAKLHDQGASNDYLANIVSEDYWKAAEALGLEGDGGQNPSYPYPTAEEAPAIRSGFDHFFNVIETKPGEGGRVTLFQRTAPTAKPFYSALTRAAENAKLTKGTPDQWLATIKNTPGVKADEISWSGIEDWLKDQKGPVTKQQVADYLRANEVQVQEVEKGDALTQAERAEYHDLTERNKDPEALSDEEVNRLNDLQTKDEGGPAKYSSYVLLGGKNYREMLLTLPSKGDGGLYGEAAASAYNSLFRDLHGQYGDGFANKAKPEEMAQLADLNRRSTLKAPKDDFRSGHFDEPNVLAHVRFDDRTGPNGEKILHVAEFQSDWSAKGRKQGFAGAQLAEGEVLRAVQLKDHPNLWRAADASGESPTLEHFTTEDAAQKYADHMNEAKRATGVPDMPFKKTETWMGLAAKRMLRYAAENGYDRLSWDTGDTNAARYDLSKHVSKIEYEPTDDGKFELGVFGTDGRGIDSMEREYTPKEIEETFGKDIADKMASGHGERVHGDLRNWRSLSGLDLKVGTQGMAGFYDKMLPAYLNKYAKKWGAKVEQSRVDTENKAHTTPEYEVFHDEATGAWILEDRQGLRLPETFDTENAAHREANKLNGGEPAAVHSIAITPPMRESVMQGQPMFQRGKESAQPRPGERVKLADDIVGETIKNPSPEEAKLLNEVERVAKKLAPTAVVRAMRKLEMLGDMRKQSAAVVDGEIHGATYSDGMRRLIAWSLASPDAVGTVRHEVLHYLYGRGLIRPYEWQALTDAAHDGDWIGKHDIAAKYPDAPPNLAMEEAIAEELGQWRRNEPTNIPKALQPMWARITQFLRQVADGARRVLGKDVMADDVMSRIMSGEIGRRAGTELDRNEPMFQTAYHGTPHDFDQFSNDKIGTGEGSQAFGWGHYFAGKKAVAEFYRDSITNRRQVTFKTPGGEEKTLSLVADKIKRDLGLNTVYAPTRILHDIVAGQSIADIKKSSPPDWKPVIEHIAEQNYSPVQQGKGRLFEVNLKPKEEEYLDWDKPLAKQSDYVKEALNRAGLFAERKPPVWENNGGDYYYVSERGEHPQAFASLKARQDGGYDVYNHVGPKAGRDRGYSGYSPTLEQGKDWLEKEVPRTAWDDNRFDRGAHSSYMDAGLIAKKLPQYADMPIQQASSMYLKDNGIPGIKFLDQGSRSKGEGTHNYVVFDPAHIEVKTKYQRIRRLPENMTQAGDRLDETADVLADTIKGQSPGTYERTLARMAPPSGGAEFKSANTLEKNFSLFPHTLAKLDTYSGRFWNEWKARTSTTNKIMQEARDLIAPTFLKLKEADRNKVYAAEELDRIDNTVRSDDGRSIVVRNNNIGTARFSKPGEVVVLKPEQTKAYYERRAMFQNQWDRIMEGAARKLGWDGEWSDDMAANIKAMKDEIESTADRGTKKSLERAVDVLGAMQEQRRQAYVPLMRYGDYYMSVTPKTGADKSSLGGFPKTEWFELAEKPAMADWTGERFRTGDVPKYAQDKIDALRKRFPPDKYNIEHGYLFNKADTLRQLDIPAVEKLLMVMEGGAFDHLYDQERARGFNKQEAKASAKSKYDQLYGQLVDELRDQMYEELKAGFKKRSRTVPGYDSDWDRATGSYMHWTARNVADQIHHNSIEEAYNQIQTQHPSKATRQYWNDWRAYQDRPSDAFSRAGNAASRVGFIYTLAGNISSAVVNATDPLISSIPTLSVGIGMKDAAPAFSKAAMHAVEAMRADTTRGLYIDPAKAGKSADERKMLTALDKDGYLHPMWTQDMEALNDRQSSLWGNLKAPVRRALDIASSNMGVTEQAKRVALALSAYRLAKTPATLKAMDAAWSKNQVWRALREKDGVTPENMARFMTSEGAYEWGKENQAPAMRGPIGQAAFLLHGFQTRFLSNAWNLLHNMGPDGKRALLWMAAAVWAGSGIEGLPFAQDAENLADQTWKFFTGKDPMMAYRIRALLADAGFGKVGAEMVMRGPVSTVTGVNLADRIGFGDILSREFSSDTAAGLPLTIWSVFSQRAMAMKRRLESGQYGAAAAEALPGALRNIVLGGVQADQGLKSQTGRTIVPASKVSGADAIKRGIGFQPNSQERVYEAKDYQYRAPRARMRAPHNAIPKPDEPLY